MWSLPGRSRRAPCFSSAAASPARAAWMRLSGALTGILASALENQGNGPVVGKRYRHVGLEDSGLDGNPCALRGGHKVFVELPRFFGGGGFIEAGTAAFAAIAIESELGDY